MCVDADSSTRRVRVPRYRYPESGCSSTGGAGPASIREYSSTPSVMEHDACASVIITSSESSREAGRATANAQG